MTDCRKDIFFSWKEENFLKYNNIFICFVIVVFFSDNTRNANGIVRVTSEIAIFNISTFGVDRLYLHALYHGTGRRSRPRQWRSRARDLLVPSLVHRYDRGLVDLVLTRGYLRVVTALLGMHRPCPGTQWQSSSLPDVPGEMRRKHDKHDANVLSGEYSWGRNAYSWMFNILTPPLPWGDARSSISFNFLGRKEQY